MKRRNILSSLLAVVATFLMIGFTAGASKAQAQSIPPGPCPDYWVNYNYVYPPAPAGSYSFAIECADGRIFPPTSELLDGHYTYKSDPTCIPTQIHVTWIDPGTGLPVTVVFPIPGGPFSVPTPWGVLRVETKFDSNGCLEVKVSH